MVDFSCRAPRGGRVVDCFGARAPTITPEVRDGSTLGFSSGIGRYLFGAYARDQAGNTADVDVVFFADPVCFDRQATLVDGDYGTPATEGDDVFVVAFRGGQGEVHGLGGDDRLCAAGVIDGGPGYDRCQGPASVDNTFRNCEVVVER